MVGTLGGMRLNNEFTDFEKLYRKELDRIYKTMGVSVERIYGKDNEKYDVMLRIDDAVYTVEEKGLRYYYPDAPIELIQDVISCNLGWYYKTKARFIIFIYYDDILPVVLYSLNFPKLKIGIKECFGNNKVKLKSALKGYGITVNMCIPWVYLIKEGIVKILKDWRE